MDAAKKIEKLAELLGSRRCKKVNSKGVLLLTFESNFARGSVGHFLWLRTMYVARVCLLRIKCPESLSVLANNVCAHLLMHSIVSAWMKCTSDDNSEPQSENIMPRTSPTGTSTLYTRAPYFLLLQRERKKESLCSRSFWKFRCWVPVITEQIVACLVQSCQWCRQPREQKPLRPCSTCFFLDHSDHSFTKDISAE